MTQFGDEKTLGTLFLDLSKIKINKKEKNKDFNQIFTTLHKKIPDKPTETVQMEFYTCTLPTPIAMFLKRKEKQTLVVNLEEAIKV
jgi:hypothetical protein